MRIRMLKVCVTVPSLGIALVAAALASTSNAQTAPATPAPTAPTQTAAAPAAVPSSLDALAWLRGCWLGTVNRREFLEQWSPPRGGMMVGFSHTVVAPRAQGSAKDQGEAATEPGKDKTQDFEYLRIEARADGIYYVAVPSGKKEVGFKLSEVSEDSGAKLFTFTNLADEFPQRLVYRHGTGGWLYAQVGGKPGAAPDIIYPMRHVDCATDALLKE
jgi:Domain of unknown function (DUF6265)